LTLLVTQPESATAAHGFHHTSANIHGFTPAPTSTPLIRAPRWPGS